MSQAGDTPVTGNLSQLTTMQAYQAANVAFQPLLQLERLLLTQHALLLHPAQSHFKQHSEHTQSSVRWGMFACVCILKHFEQSPTLPAASDVLFMQLVS